MTLLRLQWPLGRDIDEDALPEGLKDRVLAEMILMTQMGLEVDPQVSLILDAGDLVATISIETPVDWDEQDTAGLLSHLQDS